MRCQVFACRGFALQGTPWCRQHTIVPLSVLRRGFGTGKGQPHSGLTKAERQRAYRQRVRARNQIAVGQPVGYPPTGGA